MGHTTYVTGGDLTRAGTYVIVATVVVAGIGAVAIAQAGAEAVGTVLGRHPTTEEQSVMQRF